MLDFGALPPEVNSARMYAGPGSGSLMNAASAWNQLAAELNSAAVAYTNVTTSLSSEQWLGPASSAMAQSVAPYIEWMNNAAADAEQAAGQARAAASAYETAVATTVPLNLIAANRTALQEALTYNVFGQYTGQIAAIEAQYAEMWAQDANAMYSYAGQSAAASKVTPFTAAPPIVSPSAQAAQASATSSAAATSAGASQSTLSQLVSALPGQLNGLSSPVSAAATTTSPDLLTELWFLVSGNTALPTNVGSFFTGISPYSSWLYSTEGLPYFTVGMSNSAIQTSKTLGLLNGPAGAAAAGGGSATGMSNLGGLLGGGGGPVGAGALHAEMGNSDLLGDLAIPPNWSQATNAVSHPARVAAHSMTPVGQGGAGNLMGGMPLAGPHGAASAAGPKYGFRPKVMARPPFAG